MRAWKGVVAKTPLACCERDARACSSGRFGLAASRCLWISINPDKNLLVLFRLIGTCYHCERIIDKMDLWFDGRVAFVLRQLLFKKLTEPCGVFQFSQYQRRNGFAFLVHT